MSEYVKPVQVLSGTTPLLQATENDMQVASGDNPIYTNALGLAGFSDGVTVVTINVNNAIPQGGYEINWVDIMLLHATLDLGYKVGTTLYTVRGRVLTANTSSGPQKAAGVQMSFQGKVIAKTTTAL